MRKITATVVAALLGMPALTLAENSDTVAVAVVANGVSEGS